MMRGGCHYCEVRAIMSRRYHDGEDDMVSVKKVRDSINRSIYLSYLKLSMLGFSIVHRNVNSYVKITVKVL